MMYEDMVNIITTDVGKLYYWFDFAYKQQLNKFRDKKSLQREIILSKLQSLGYRSDIKTFDNGKPYLESLPELTISISHANGWFAFYIASRPVGVDIQDIKNSITKAPDYFMCEPELAAFQTMKELHVVWCAKEAFYKYKSGQIESYKKGIIVHQIDEKKMEVKVKHNDMFYILSYEFIRNAVLVYTK